MYYICYQALLRLKMKNRVYLVHIYTSKAKSKELQDSHHHK